MTSPIRPRSAPRWPGARRVSGKRETVDLRGDGWLAVRVVVKVRFAPFFTTTHGVTLDEPIADPVAIADAAGRALERFELDRPVRLLGVRAELAAPVVQVGG